MGMLMNSSSRRVPDLNSCAQVQCRKLFLSAQEPSVSAPSCTVRTEMGMSRQSFVFTEELKKMALGLNSGPGYVQF